ncbi:MAG TPA: CAP domain-containing protein [Cellulomonas sp.]
MTSPRQPARAGGRLGWVLLTLAGTLALAAAVTFVLRPDVGTPAPAPSVSVSVDDSWTGGDVDLLAYAAQLVEGTRQARVSAGLDPLQASACATGHALVRADDLTGGGPLEHAPLDQVLADCAVPEAAENLSRAAASPQDVMQAWLASPGHRNNLLDPTLDEVGIGCVADDGQVLCSQVFLGH